MLPKSGRTWRNSSAKTLRCQCRICDTPLVNPFYLADVSGRLRAERIEEAFGSWSRFERQGFFSPLFENDPQVAVSLADNTALYRLPPEPETIEAFANQYPDFPEKPYIVYFRRTAIRRNGCMLSFTIGFDVNLAAALANIQLLDAVTALKWKIGPAEI